MANNKSEEALHPRNRHRGRYDLERLIEAHPDLERFVAENKFGDRSINFFDPKAVKSLNYALLRLYYGVQYWDIPPSALTPPIPGRADYIHYLADLIGVKDGVRCLDIGVGANCIYPIIGSHEYGWSFVGSDIDPLSIENAREIVERNTTLRGRVELRLQMHKESIFEGVIEQGDYFDVTICNPPFHDSPESAQRGTLRKLRNLKGGKNAKNILNFSGSANELWCDGGELRFITTMIRESANHKKSCGWFTTLVSNEDNLRPLRRELNRLCVREVRTIDMHQGNKRSRILAWRY